MRQISKFKDSPSWPEVRESLAQEARLDEEAIALVGEQEGDSLDLVEICIAFEESFSSRVPKRSKS